MQVPYSYGELISSAERARWQIDDLLPRGATFDFRRPFLPEALAPTDALSDPCELLLLNQIRAHAYLGIIGLIEECILPFVLDHARPAALADEERTRALIGFAGEEAKHVQLFRRFRATFVGGFGVPCGLIGPAETLVRRILAEPPLGVALMVLHAEWMTQRHWLDCADQADTVEPRFAALLRHHWAEEAQHARLDSNMVAELGATLSGSEVLDCVDAYLRIVLLLDGALRRQAELDLDSFERAVRRRLTPAGREQFLERQLAVNRQVYLISGMTHPRVLASLEALHPYARDRVEAAAASLV